MDISVTIEGTGEFFAAQPGETILAAAQRQGVRLAHDCQLGGCGTCRIKLVAGTVRYDEPPFALTENEANEGYALACQAQPTGDLVIDTCQADETPSEPTRQTVLVQSLRHLADDVAHLVLVLPGDAPVPHRPGQYIKLYLPDGGTRSFSMASMPRGNMIDFHIRIVTGGIFTGTHLPALRQGDTLDIEFPDGSFVLRKADDRPLVMVATGTGLAPIKAMLESLMEDPDCPPVSLYWGARRATDLYLDAEIRCWGEQLYDFRYVPVLSRPDMQWVGRRGYVQEAVIADFDDLSQHSIYLCGSPLMIADCKKRFLSQGASVNHLYAEAFTHERAPAGAFAAMAEVSAP